jgi:hypothetical protein
VSFLLWMVDGSWPLSWLNACAVTCCTVLAYSFGYTVLEYYVFARGCFSFTTFYYLFESFVVGALVLCTPLLWPINTPWRAAAIRQSLDVELVVLWSRI